MRRDAYVRAEVRRSCTCSNDKSRGFLHLADAHVVALCLDADDALVITTDPDDVRRLAAPFPGLRLLVRRP